jgi:hypothetical protein
LSADGQDQCPDGKVAEHVKAGGMTIKIVCIEDLEGIE